MIQFDEYLSSNGLVQPRNWFYSPSNPPFGGSMVYLLFPSILWCKPKFRVSQKKKRCLIKGCFDPPFSREIDVGTSPERNVGNLLPQHGGSWTCWNESWWFSVGNPSRFLEKNAKKNCWNFHKCGEIARTPWCWPSMEMFGKCHKNWFQYHGSEGWVGLPCWLLGSSQDLWFTTMVMVKFPIKIGLWDPFQVS